MVALGVVVPLALYLFLLGLINRRTRPLLVPGTWDFVGLLFGLSGFVVFLGPEVIAVLHGHRETWFGVKPDEQTDWASFLRGWGLVYVGYFVIVVGGVVWTLLARQRQTAIYNIDPEPLADALTEVLHAEGLPFSQIGNVVKIGTDNPSYVEVEASLTLHHATLKWPPGPNPVRAQVELKLMQALDRTEAPENPFGLLFLSAASLLLLASLFGMGLWIGLTLIRG